jgi:hypothetical protein
MRSREATLANMEKLAAGNYIERSADADHAYTYRVRILLEVLRVNCPELEAGREASRTYFGVRPNPRSLSKNILFNTGFVGTRRS